jgi:hypothetical protein
MRSLLRAGQARFPDDVAEADDLGCDEALELVKWRRTHRNEALTHDEFLAHVGFVQDHAQVGVELVDDCRGVLAGPTSMNQDGAL